MKTMLIVNWCGPGQEFVPDADGDWRLGPVLSGETRELD